MAPQPFPPKPRPSLRYQALLKEMPEAEATEATIHLDLPKLLQEMGGAGVAPDVKAHSSAPVTDNVTAFKRPPPPRPKPAGGPQAKSRLPVPLIFACLVVVYVGIRYLLQ